MEYSILLVSSFCVYLWSTSGSTHVVTVQDRNGCKGNFFPCDIYHKERINLDYSNALQSFMIDHAMLLNWYYKFMT